MAMFDMADFVYLSDGRRLAPADTPLGRSLLAEGVLTAEKLQAFKRDPLRYARRGEHRLLHYLPLAGEGRDLDWTREFLRAF
jgi:hypothetical protein